MRCLAVKLGCYDPKNAKHAYCHDNIMDGWEGANGKYRQNEMIPGMELVMKCATKQMD